MFDVVLSMMENFTVTDDNHVLIDNDEDLILKDLGWGVELKYGKHRTTLFYDSDLIDGVFQFFDDYINF